MAVNAAFWPGLDPRYRFILCDVWGVVHDGVRLYPGAAERMMRWREEGRFVLLITNAPRTAEAVERHLGRLKLPIEAWDAIATGGDTGIEALNALERAVGFVGTASDRSILEREGVRIASGEEFSDVAVIGFDLQRPSVEDYRLDLLNWAERGVHMHCLNPDRVVVYGGRNIPCAGAIADAYEEVGGAVSWYGKPFEPIYRRALQLAGNPPRDAVLAVGDGLQTDMLGAAWLGFDAVFVAGGIHSGEAFPDAFTRQHDLADWRPVAVVDALL